MTDYLVARLLHFYGFAVWVGTLFGTASILQFRATLGDEMKAKVTAFARAGMIMGDIGATLTLGGGIYMMLKIDAMRQPYMHIKLTLIAVMLGLHVFIRVRAKRGGTFPKPLFGLMSLVAIGIMVVIIFKPLAR